MRSPVQAETLLRWSFLSSLQFCLPRCAHIQARAPLSQPFSSLTFLRMTEQRQSGGYIVVPAGHFMAVDLSPVTTLASLRILRQIRKDTTAWSASREVRSSRDARDVLGLGFLLRLPCQSTGFAQLACFVEVVAMIPQPIETPLPEVTRDQDAWLAGTTASGNALTLPAWHSSVLRCMRRLAVRV